MIKTIALALIIPFLAACSDASMKFPVTESAQSAIENIDIVRLSAKNISSFGLKQPLATPTNLPVRPVGEYVIGAGDVISIFVFDHPELAVPTGGNTVNTGFLVRSDGSLTYPFVGSVPAAGMTVEGLRQALTALLETFFPSPQVDVRVATFNSQRVVIGGEVASPTTQSVQTSPMTLLEAINAAGGMTQNADASAITVRRGGNNYTVDLNGFLSAGLAANNPVLIGGDVVSVPRKILREAYLLGEIQRPSTIDLTDETITLTQAITRQGGMNEARADARGVFVFREVSGKMTVYQLDTSLPTALLLGAKFTLQPSDVIYITKSPLQRWNDSISRILPSVNAAKTTAVGF
jgi:polysaccharide biosynthesis/export protein